MRDFPVPVVAWGPGSQPVDEEFDYVRMPGAEPLPTPRPPRDAASGDRIAAAAVVAQLIESMASNAASPIRFSLKSMAPGALRALNESLGEGEVSAKVQSSRPGGCWRIQETAFPGVWRVLHEDARGQRLEDVLEAGEMPTIVTDTAARANRAYLDASRLAGDVINARPVVDELRHHARRYRPGDPAHVVNLTLLPFGPADHASLDAVLGEGPIAILSRGFGNCRITSTLAANIWRVRFYNTMNTVILDTIEVVDIPEAARAAREDIAESRERLAELLEWMREPQ